MKRAAVLLVLLGAVMLVFAAPMAEAALEKIRCTSNWLCEGTDRGDRLIDRADSFTEIRGEDGDDTYVERSGSSDSADTLWDRSDDSDDTYYIARDDFNTASNDALWILDWGGNRDLLDLSATGYRDRDCDPERTDARGDGSRNDLYIDCPGRDNIIVFDYYTSRFSIEKFRFANGTFEGPSLSSSAAESATTQEQITTQEQQASKKLPDKKQSGEVSDQAEKNASSAEGWGQKAEQTRESTSSGG